ncbi:MFS transporter [Ferrovibrio sp.]|uniref:MFS transporter n=1 Tax=Ferrovibrio sp. TaxID=1917215 RepID=UPI0025BB6730|nr:MFS transporter [Ferrovibrio sp.]MBX3453563.1 MFS transporter [Ferrovibrio sp.]
MNASTAPDMKPSDSGPFARNGWPLVIALSVAQLVSWGSIFYAFAVLLEPMEAELGWSRPLLNAGLSMGLLVSGFCALPVGKLIDRYGGRWTMSFGSLLASLLLFAWSQVESVPAYFAIWLGLGLAKSMTLYEPVFAVVTRLFPQGYRQRITVITLAGGLASTVFIPFTAWAVSAHDWRDALQMLALCNLLLCLPVHALWLRDGGLRDGGAGDRGSHEAKTEAAPQDKSPLQRALRHPSFWGILLCFTCHGATMAVMAFHFIPLLGENGIGLAAAVAVYALIGPSQVAGRLLLLFGRGLPFLITGQIVMALFPVVILVLILWPGELWLLFGFAIVYGSINGIATILRGTAVPEMLWREGYGAINGAISLPASIANALAPAAAALLWQWSGGYDAVLWVMFGLLLTSAAAFWFAAAKSGSKRD